jgi:parallel beta-helix repeat protein
MKNLNKLMNHIWLMLCMMTISSVTFAQAITFNTTTGTTGYTGGNSAGTGTTAYITFAIQNNSGAPIKLTKVGNYVITGDGPHTLYYSSTSLSGAVDLTLTSVWLNAGGTNSTIPSSTASVQEVLNNINFIIPNGVTYRFALQKAAGTNRYSGAAAGDCSPSTFTNGGVTLLCGEAMIAGSYVGYGAGNNPRWFTGTVTYERMPQGPNNAGISKIVSPLSPFCAGPQDISVRLKNSGTNVLYNVNIKWRLDNVLQTPVTFSSPLDTFGGSLYPNDTTVVLATGIPFTAGRTLKVWTELPNSVADTSNGDDTLLINLTPALNGNFTIGGASPNFATVDAAVTALTTYGICGPVKFTIRPGTYTGQINLTSVAGVSATNTITFEGTDKNTTIITYAYTSGAYATWTNDNVSYVTLKNLTINGTNSTTAWGIRLSNAHNCKIINCIVNVPVYSGTTSMGIVVAGSPTSYTTAGRADSLTIDSVTVNGGYYGIISYGASAGQNIGLRLTNTKMLDYYTGGLYQYYSSSVTISNNQVTHLNTTGATYGMYFSSLGNAGGVANTITNNTVNSIGTYGIYFTTASNPSATNKGLFANNVVMGEFTTYGIYMSAGTNWRIAHNTSWFKTNTSTVTYVPAYITGGSAITCVNNIFRTQSTASYSFYGSAATIFDTLNYNVYSKDVKGANYFYLGSAYTDVTMIGAGSRNANSVSLNPDFVSTTSVMTKRSCLSGMAVPTVATDINGITRNALTPTIGAYEVTPVSNDARVEALNQPLTLATLGAQDASVLIRNEGTVTLTSLNVTIRVNSRTPVTVPWSGFLAPCDTVSVLFNGGSQVIFDSLSKITVYTSSPNASADLKTINDTLKSNMYAPLSGTYTIGGTSPNFADINEAVSILKLAGVVGPVTFNVRPGTYSGQVYMNLIPGVSSTNTITFVGANKATTIVTYAAATGDYATWTIDNVSFVTLRNLTINATHTTNAFGVRLNTANNCRIINCNVNVPVNNVTTAAGIVVSGSGTSYSTAGRADSLTIDSVIVTGGYFSISSYGAAATISTGLKLTNTKVIDYTNYGFYLYYSSNVIVSNNTVTHLSSTPSTYGMYFSSLGNAGGVANVITNNIVNSIGTAGIYFTTASNPSATNKGVITNNVISGNYTSYGMYMTAGTNWRIAHNTYFNTNISATTTIVPAYITGGSAIACFNNIFRTLSNSTGYTFYGSAATIFDTLDYNVYSKDLKGANYFYLGSALTDATLIGSGSKNTNSKTANPAFTDETSANLIPLSANIDNVALVVAGITTDITGALRSTTTPDPGAFEFTGVSSDIAFLSGDLIRSGGCYSFNDTAAFTIQNLIGSTIDFSVTPLTINWNVTGPLNTTGTTFVSTGTLAPGAQVTVKDNTVNRNINGTYTLRANIQLNTTTNLIATNDTLVPVVSVVKPILSVSPKTVTVTSNTDTVVLRANSPIFPGGNAFFTEVAHYKTTIGQPTAGWPAYLLADDYVEITGVPNSDLAGFTMEEWTGTTLQYSNTFPTGTLFSPNGTMILATGQLTGSVPSPANFYYHTGNTTTHSSTGDIRGYILKNPSGTIIDVTMYGAYTFPAASGVTAADWTGSTPAVSSSGNTMNAPDNNSGTCWVNSGTVAQTPNALNAGITAPVPGTLTGFDWKYNLTSFSTSPQITVGPYTTPGVYKYIATWTNTCGTFYDTAYVTASATVPVKLTTFTATKANADVKLDWQTASEVNNNRFEIERSVNGRDFTAIGRVKGMGTKTTPSRYAFTDEGIVRTTRSTSLYYRLKQVDNDGTVTYSKVATVRLGDKQTTISVYPNPSNGNVTITSVSNQTATIRVVNIMGATVLNQSVNPVAGTIDLNLQLPDGIYMLLMEQDGETSSHKLIIRQ